MTDTDDFRITVNPVNDAPVAVDDDYDTDEDTPLTIHIPGVLVNDSDVDDDSLTAVVDGGSIHGNLIFNDNGSFTYTPDANFNGEDSFTYLANDGLADSNIATVTVTINPVNDAPAANDDVATTDEDTAVTIDVLTNDSDIDGDTLTIDSVTQGTQGTVAINPDNTVTYTPDANFNGIDFFTYNANDGLLDSNVATVTISVWGCNDAPVALDDAYTTAEDTPLVIAGPGVLGNDIDFCGDALTAGLDTDVSNGTLTLNADGSFNYSPDADFNDIDSFTYRALNGIVFSNAATVTIAVTPVNDAPILEPIGDKSINENNLLTFTVNATDADADTIMYSAQSLPSGATFSSQTFTWMPSYDQAGMYQVTFTADDGQAQDYETITITVVNVNRAPMLTTIGNKSAYADVLLTFTLDATDPDGDGITYSTGPLPSGATFTGQGFDWTPSQSQAGSSYAITFIVSDVQLQDSETVTITVDVDSLAPTVTNCSPTTSSIQVPLNNLISLHIADTGAGVDADSVTIKVNNNIVFTGDTSHYTCPDGDCRRLGTKADYTFVYQADEMFDYEQAVTVTVNAIDLAGNPMDEYSYSFVTEMRLFGQNKKVNSGLNNLNNDKPVTVRDSNGNIWAAWHAGPIGNRDIYIAKLAAGAENFGSTVQLTNDSTDQCNPAVALDSNDKLYVVWQDNRQGDWDIYVSTSIDGITWSSETKVNDPNNGNQVNPAVVIDGQSPSYTHVVWQDDRTGNQDICMATSSDGFATKTVSQITSDSSDQVEPAVAADSDNTIYVVWTDGRNGSNDIYGAVSNNPWTNVAIVSNTNNQSSPAIATESTGPILHLLWVEDTSGDNDIYYASSNGLLGSPLTGSSIIDDSSGADQLEPAIAVTGSTGNNLKVFACWQDWRNTDTDMYFTELSFGSSTNVFVDDGGSSAYQGEPAIGIDEYDHPYIMWADSRSTNTDIYYAGSTFVAPVLLASELVTASNGAIVGANPASITDVDDVSVIVPAGACWFDVKITISKINNPQSFTAPYLGSYDFVPSGIQFNQPVTITIPYLFSDSDSSATPYWFNSLTGALSQQGITDIHDIVISPTLHALSFNATHFTAFYLLGDALDETAPIVTINTLLSIDSTPELTGTVDDLDAAIEVTVAGSSYSAVNNGDGTWTLADNTISPALRDGTYDAAVAATDLAGNVGTDATTAELVIDTTSPVVTVDTLLTNDSTPELTGTVDDPDAAIEVTVNSSSYGAVNNGDGTWTLPDDTISPVLADGVYEVSVSATDLAGNVGNDTTVDELEVVATQEQWVPYVPSAEQTEIDIWNDGTRMYARVTLWFPSAGYAVEDWGTLIHEGSDFSADSRVLEWTGMSAQVITEAWHDYDMGVLAPGNYWFTFMSWGIPIETIVFLVEDLSSPVLVGWFVEEDTGMDPGDKLTNDTTPEPTFTFSEAVFGDDSDIEVLDPGFGVVVLDSITGWGSDTLIVTFTTPLVMDGQYTVTLKGAATITDEAGNALNDGSDEIVTFTLNTTTPVVTVNNLLTNDTTPELTGTVDDPDATIEVTVDGNNYSTVNNGDGTWTLADDTISLALVDGIYDVAVTATDLAGNVGTDGTTAELTVDTTVQLCVILLETIPSGFIANFNRQVEPDVLNLYDTEAGIYGPADFTVTGDSVGPVAGSLICNEDGTIVSFIKTGGPLEPDTYLVTLRSADTGFKDSEGHLLDGNADDVEGGDYVTTVTVEPTTARMMAIPDFARGPGQDVNVPAMDSGIPMTISDGSDILAVYSVFDYDPALLTVTGVTLASGLPNDWALAYNLGTPGHVPVTVYGPTSLEAG